MKNQEVTGAFLSSILILILLFTAIRLVPVAANWSNDTMNASLSLSKSSIVRPVIYHSSIVDKDLDRIQDSLEDLIKEAQANMSAVFPVIVTLNNKVTEQDLNKFALQGGQVTRVYNYVTYGLAGRIRGHNIERFVASEKQNLCIIEYDAPLRYHLDVSVPLIRARPIVLSTDGFTGSSSQSIAIVDTGIDDSHSDLGPYGNLNFSNKLIGWYDATTDDSLTPQDYGEHGSHVAGIAAGTGAANPLQGSGNIKTTFTYELPTVGWGYTDFLDILTPGEINLKATWGGSNRVRLQLDDPSGTTVRSVSGSGQPLTLTCTTAGTSYPTGRYRVAIFNLAGPSGTPFSCVETYPYQGLNDGYNLFTGVAPNAKLVGVKVFNNAGSGAISSLISGLDWIVQNRMVYHIVVASMSLGLLKGETDTTLDQKVDTLVENGIVVTVSAGNDYPNYTVASPGTAAYATTVGATNDQNGVTDYSSNGDTAKNEYGLIKPDVVAPGGTFNLQYGNQIISVDSNDVDGAYSGYADQNPDDYQQMAGTSMAAPHVAGLAALVAQAMGQWNWTLTEALKVKMLISMTAFEVQIGEGTNVPPLNRGDKDSVEGYGRISADAAIEAATMSHTMGDAASDTLDSTPSGKKVWARQVILSANNTYEFKLSLPSSADYDLYLYNETPDSYGQPIVLKKSINASNGGQESFQYTALYSGTYYVVVKWVNGSGTFNISSSLKPHDVAVLSASHSAIQAYAGNMVNISVVVKNEGAFNETFGVATYYDSVQIEAQMVVNLVPNATQTVTFSWNTTGVSPGSYLVTATAAPLLHETDLSDNSLNARTIYVKIPGDTNNDGIVDVLDAAAVSAHWYPGPPVGPLGYDVNFDINQDETISVLDAGIVSAYWTSPPKGPSAP